MIRVVDKNGDMVVQKVTKPNGEALGYQFGIPGQKMTQSKTLGAARTAIGKPPMPKRAKAKHRY